MPSTPQTFRPNGLHLGLFSISQETLLQLGTGTVIIALLGGKAVAQTLLTLGQASEEMFRGDRLPGLKFPSDID